MMYPYIILADETEITHSHIIMTNEVETVEVHFERPTETGFDSARCILPSYNWKFIEGYSADEIRAFEELLHHNAHLFFKYAKAEGNHII